MKNILRYLEDEHLACHGEKLENVDAWRNNIHCVDVARQKNQIDCGVFICQFAKCIVNGHNIGLVDQRLVSQSRRTMLSEITTKKLGEMKLIEE